MARSTKVDTKRRGRPKAGERPERERRILDAALTELMAHGYERVTMLAVAKRAGSSKETLYNWYGSKEGLFGALIKDNSNQVAARIEGALDADADPAETLVGLAIGLLTLLTSDDSVALNRAAMSSPELAAVLLANGRHRAGPLVEAYLTQLNNEGHINVDDSAEAFQLLYGLILRDIQIRVLLGELAPSPSAIRSQAKAAVEQFLILQASDAKPKASQLGR